MTAITPITTGFHEITPFTAVRIQKSRNAVVCWRTRDSLSGMSRQSDCLQNKTVSRISLLFQVLMIQKVIGLITIFLYNDILFLTFIIEFVKTGTDFMFRGNEIKSALKLLGRIKNYVFRDRFFLDAMRLVSQVVQAGSVPQKGFASGIQLFRTSSEKTQLGADRQLLHPHHYQNSPKNLHLKSQYNVC